MSRLEQPTNQSVTILDRPTDKYLEVKNKYETEIFTNKKGVETTTESLDRMVFQWSKKVDEEWVVSTLELPVEFALLYPDDLTCFKGISKEKVFYYSNEVKTNDQLITVKSKNGILIEFTLAEYNERDKTNKKEYSEYSKNIRAKLLTANVKKHNSVYAALKNENGEFELVNFQFKGSTCGGRRGAEKEELSGWWAFSSYIRANRKVLTNFIQVNDWTIDKMEKGNDYCIPNFILGNKISKEENEEIEVLYDKLVQYHEFYFSKPDEVIKEDEAEEKEQIESKIGVVEKLADSELPF